MEVCSNYLLTAHYLYANSTLNVKAYQLMIQLVSALQIHEKKLYIGRGARSLGRCHSFFGGKK
jgi:hypothetical protein